MEPAPVNVCITADDKFAPYAATTLFSLLDNFSGNLLNIYYVTEHLTPSSKSRTHRALDPFNVRLNWIDAPSELDKLPQSGWTAPISHARMFMNELLPNHVKTVLYLDSDMLVLDDISRIWRNPDDDFVLMACSDNKYPTTGKTRSNRLFTEIGIEPDSDYFNSGLMMINLDNFRIHDYLEQYLLLVKQYGESFSHCDQDIMNIIFNNKWEKLEGNWNATTYDINHNEKSREEASILHFTGPKPFNHRCRHLYKNLYFKYFYRSGWFTKTEYFHWRTGLWIGNEIKRIQKKK